MGAPNPNPLELRLEALLFAGGTPLSVHDLTEKSGAKDHREVQQAISRLLRNYASRQSSLEIRRVGDRYALQLKEAFLPGVHSVQPVEIPPRTLKALTLIAYHQPMLQSLLVRMVGALAYEQVERLRELELIRAEPKGATLELTTTSHFAECFGIGSSRPQEIREFLVRKLGISPSPPPPSTEAPAAADPAEASVPLVGLPTP